MLETILYPGTRFMAESSTPHMFQTVGTEDHDFINEMIIHPTYYDFLSTIRRDRTIEQKFCSRTRHLLESPLPNHNHDLRRYPLNPRFSTPPQRPPPPHRPQRTSPAPPNLDNAASRALPPTIPRRKRRQRLLHLLPHAPHRLKPHPPAH